MRLVFAIGVSAINVRLVSSGGLYEGDSIRINLNGTILDEYNGMLQLDNVDVDINVQKFFTPNNDGVNDYWIIEGLDRLPESVVRIYDRYGKLIHIQKGGISCKKH